MISALLNPPRNGEVARAKRVTEGAHLSASDALEARRDPSTILRMVPLPVPGRI
jgi:hypothetical protein